jgi:alanine racemase
VTESQPPIEARLAQAGLPPLPRRAWLEIDLDALAGNLAAVRTLVPDGTRVAAVVKDDAYGHGVEGAARAFNAAGADRLCVATLDEGLQMRRAGLDLPVLVIFPVPADGLGAAAEARIDVVLSEPGNVAQLAAARLPPEGRLAVHLEVETGLQRGGVTPASAAALAETIAGLPGVRLAGLFSHLASSHDAGFSAGQRQRLAEAIEGLVQRSVPVPPVHLDATGGLFAGTGAPYQLVRPGLCLYGELPPELPIAPAAREAASRLRPAIALKARPVRVMDVAAGTPVGYGGTWTAPRASRIATLPIGYGDGYWRTTQPGAEVLLRGRRVPIVGSIAMDAMEVDVTDVPGAGPDDELVLLGAQGEDRISARELARRRTTIPWEVLSSLARRLPRVYHAAAGLRSVRTLAGEFLVREETQ